MTMERSFQLISQYDWRPSFIAWGSLVVVSIITYFATSLKSNLAIRNPKRPRKPPIAPYWLPILGNLFPFIWNPPEFCANITAKYGYSTPVRLRLGPFKMFLVSDADHYLSLFSNKSSRMLNTKGAVLVALKNLFGTPADVIPFYAADNSGVNLTPLPNSRVKPEHRITYFQTRAAHKYLSGPALVQMTARFLRILKQQMESSKIESEWVEYPDLYAFIQDNVFRAAVEAMCGSQLLALSPSFVEDFWEFTSAVPTLITGLPYWMSPKCYNVRSRLLEAVKKWHRMAHKNSDCTRVNAEDPEWEPFFGSKLIRERQRYSAGLEAMNADALASEDLGLLFATNTNSIPSLTWFIFEICRDHSLLARVMKEIEASHDQFGDVGIDIHKLCSQPLLQSIYAETLRLRVALFITRTPEEEEFHLGEWNFPRNVDIALSSRTAAMNPNIWNTGTVENPHPLDTFWADRFLVYPQDPTSGPSRKCESKKQFDRGSDKQGFENMSSDDFPNAETGPTFTMNGVAGGWIPYGGGQRMCPGRHFAKQEIIGTLGLLFTHFEVKLDVQREQWPESDMGFFPFGGLPPTEKIPFSIRRRAIPE